ncbi:MAG: CBS domain-containing protein [Spirochaetales bacterium]|jgi:acetoin utilization protein AcuB|nr:CBS domain-containing protein [Spirochaetales bacterium]
MTVVRQMTQNPVTVRNTAPVTEARQIMQREKIHRLPVEDKKGNLVGIVTEKDLLYASPSPASTLDVYEMAHLLSKLLVEKVMSRDVITITEDTTIEDAARIMIENNIGGLPVMRDGLIVGIVTESDLFKIFIELFGARTKGIRATLLVPERQGEIADISAAIRDKGGNIISFGTFLGENQTNALCTIKVQDISRDELLSCLDPFVEEVQDLREV